MKFDLPDGLKFPQIVSRLSDNFTVRRERGSTEKYTFYDTADWRLYNHSLVLFGNGKRLCLRRLSVNEIIESSDISAQPVFVGDFPDGALKERLSDILEMRALLELFEMELRSKSIRILNIDEKTVTRVAYEEFHVDRETTTQLRLIPVRGYTKDYNNVRNYLDEIGLHKSKERDLFIWANKASGKTPGDYSSKLAIRLKPNMHTDDAMRVILRFLLGVMKKNEEGIKRDIDTEFLHDSRVAIRRTRSALSQIKNVFQREATQRFGADFSYLGKLSNRLRDLDVYLLNKKEYLGKIPSSLHRDMEPLFRYLQRERAKELRKVIAGLKSKRYERILMEWESFLNMGADESDRADNAALPIFATAKRRIYARYQSVVKSGKQITDDSEDQMLHSLRIECKKLRYLMEFFASLFPQRKIDFLIKQLKKMQDNLGRFQDLSVQEDYLVSVMDHLPLTSQRVRKTSLAIGCLIGVLHREKQEESKAFSRFFRQFSSTKNRELFRELFAN